MKDQLVGIKKMKKIISLIFTLMIILGMSASAVFSADDNFIDLRLSLVNQNPSQVIAGDIVELKVSASNLGYKIANDVVIEYIQEYPFTLISEEKIKIGTLQSTDTDSSNSQVVDFKFKVDSDISPGNYDVKFKVYEDGTSSFEEFTLIVDVITRESAEITNINNAVLTPGKIEKLSFTISNVGSSVLRDVIFSWENVDSVILPVKLDNSNYIKELKVGESIDVSYDVIANLDSDAKLYELDLTLSYEDSISGNIYTSNTVAGIYVGGDTTFDAIFSDKTEDEISFTISNIGSNDANSVTLIIPEQDGVNMVGANSQIIGNLNKGDYTATSFLMSSNTQNIDLNIEYTNSLGERKTITKNILINSGSNVEKMEESSKDQGFRPPFMSDGNQDTKGPTYRIGFVIIALVLIVFGFKYYKRRKLKVKN